MYRILYSLAVLWTFTTLITAQEIPLNPEVRTGKLDNGLTYFIKENPKPADKVELRLAINAGSILEDDDQQGLAHFMEHMNFNGTKNFPGNELVDNLQKIGVRFGQHLNAYTSFDETVYMLPVPLDDPENLDIGMTILEDWAFNADMTGEEIDKERGVVLEELRLGLGADERMRQAYFPQIFYESRYAERLPIGKKEILENFDHDVIRRFHKDWYRPDLMAVIVVGDIDADDIEKRIQKQFSSYQGPENPRERKAYEMPNHEETFVAVETDPEANFTRINLMYKDYEAYKPITEVKDYEEYLKKRLFSKMINTRLEEIQRAPNPPFSFAGSYYSGVFGIRAKGAYQSYAMTPEGKSMDALKTLLIENERIKRHGFTQSELELAKSSMMKSIEKQYNERDKQESGPISMELAYYFLENEAAPGVSWEYQKHQELIPNIKLEEVNALIEDFIKKDNRVVVITGPEKEGLAYPSKADVRMLMDKVEQMEVEPYAEEEGIESLVEINEPMGTIVKTTTNDAIGTTTWTLSNGAEVVFKSTDFQNDEILFQAVSKGGTSNFDDATHKKVDFGMSGMNEMGMLGYDKNQLSKFLSDKNASASAYIGETSEGVRGKSTKEDLETLFQMVYGLFTDINLDKEAFNSYAQRQLGIYSNLTLRPQYYFLSEYYGFMYKDNKRFYGIFPTQEQLAQTDIALAHQKMSEALSNAADFKFYFVGNIDEDKLKMMAQKYIANLPANPRTANGMYKDDGYRPLSGTHEKVWYKGTEPQASVQISYMGETDYSPKEDLTMDFLAQVLGIKLVEQLREESSGTYTSRVSGGLSKIPYGSYSFNISFPCGPENVESLIATTKAEINKLIEAGPSEEDLNKVKEAELNDYQENIETNNWWLRKLTSYYLRDWDAEKIVKYPDAVASITTNDLQMAAKKYLTGDYIQGVLLPETEKE